MLHLANGLLFDELAQPGVSPGVAHFRVKEVLADGAQLLLQHFAQYCHHLRLALHIASPPSVKAKAYRLLAATSSAGASWRATVGRSQWDALCYLVTSVSSRLRRHCRCSRS